MKAVKSLDLKHLAMFAPSAPCNLSACKNKENGAAPFLYQIFFNLNETG